MDRTGLNVVSMVLGGAGILTVLTGFNVPQLRMSFWGENPYELKRDAIANAMDWIFAGLTLIGIAIQIVAEIVGDSLPERLYTVHSYVRVTAVSVLATVGLVWLL